MTKKDFGELQNIVVHLPQVVKGINFEGCPSFCDCEDCIDPEEWDCGMCPDCLCSCDEHDCDCIDCADCASAYVDIQKEINKLFNIQEKI